MQKNSKYVLNLVYCYDSEVPDGVERHFSKIYDTYEEANLMVLNFVEHVFVKWYDINEVEV